MTLMLTIVKRAVLGHVLKQTGIPEKHVDHAAISKRFQAVSRNKPYQREKSVLEQQL